MNAEPVLDLRYKFVEDKEGGKPKTPAKGSTGAAGYDLYASKAGVVPARGKALIATNLVLEIPTGTYGRIGNDG